MRGRETGGGVEREGRERDRPATCSQTIPAVLPERCRKTLGRWSGSQEHLEGKRGKGRAREGERESKGGKGR